MYGLVKIAAEHTYNVNNSNREDRLKDEYDERLERIEALDAQRNPEIEDVASDLFAGSLGKGVAYGTGLGALGGGLLYGAASGEGLKNKVVGAGLGAVHGGVTGGLFGLGIGGSRGQLKADAYRYKHEDPELLKQIDEATLDRDLAYEKLKRHYLLKQRIRDNEYNRA